MARLGLVVRGDVVCHVNDAVPPEPVVHTCPDLPEGVLAAKVAAEKKESGGAPGPPVGKGDGRPGHHKRNEFRGREVTVVSDKTLLAESETSPQGGTEDGDGSVTIVFANGTGDVAAADADVPERCRDLGAARVLTVDPYDVEEVAAALREGLAAEGASYVVAEAPCVLRYEVRKPVYVVDPEVCNGCKHCLKVGCEALQVVEDGEGGRKVKVVAVDCVGCGLCLQLCKKGAISPSA